MCYFSREEEDRVLQISLLEFILFKAAQEQIKSARFP